MNEKEMKELKVSDILQGNFNPIDVPLIEIPGTRPLIYHEPEALIAKINKKDQFYIDDIEEEFLMFTAEIDDEEIRRKDGPH